MPSLIVLLLLFLGYGHKSLNIIASKPKSMKKKENTSVAVSNFNIYINGVLFIDNIFIHLIEPLTSCKFPQHLSYFNTN